MAGSVALCVLVRAQAGVLCTITCGPFVGGCCVLVVWLRVLFVGSVHAALWRPTWCAMELELAVYSQLEPNRHSNVAYMKR